MMRKRIAMLSMAVVAGALSGTPLAAVAEEARTTPRVQRGEASYYAPHFRGRKMANGERFDPKSNSAAHRTLPLGTTARVRNLDNGRTATVVVEDRGPYVRGRIIDLSPSTADKLDMREDGVAPVEVVPLEVPRGGDAGARAAGRGR